MSGSEISAPNRLQVPLERYSQSSPWAGTAATAAAVSWQAGAMNGAWATPHSSARFSRRVPTTEPGATTSGRKPVGMPSLFRMSPAQSERLGSYIWVVVARVNSWACSPVKK